MQRKNMTTGLFLLGTILMLLADVAAANETDHGENAVVVSPVNTGPANGKLKIFILSGQSNMVGFGQIEGTTGTMEAYLKSNPKDYGPLVDQDGQPVIRDDVWIVNLSYQDKERMGWLTTGYGADDKHIGPEYGFGFAVGDYYADPVLIIKSAWGGRSLSHNFLSPSSTEYPTPEKDGDMGFQYAEILRHVKEITGNLKHYYPAYDGKGYEIIGFGWHQGWNDRINQQAVDAYEKNMEHFIKDIRKDLGIADLPFVIANTGMGGWDIAPTARYKTRVETLMAAQLRLADPQLYPAFKDNVSGVETRHFQRPREESPSGQDYHWFRNWETLYLIGHSMGESMVNLVANRSAMDVAGLKCENLTNPLGIDAAHPRLSWYLASSERGQKQTGYRILVASSPDVLNENRGDCWDHAMTESSQSLDVSYAGAPLRPGGRYYWKVSAKDNRGRWTAWSAPAWWEQGIGPFDHWDAQWISDGKALPEKDADHYKEDPAPLFRKTFRAHGAVRRARLYISGLGYYEAYLNGERVGDHQLAPGWTQFNKRIFYNTFDVTDHVRQGDNCLGVTLGNGWYNPLPLRMWGGRNIRKALPVGRPCFIARVEAEMEDGTRLVITSDPSWKVAEGPILRNSIYLGEVYDARRELDGWSEPDFNANTWRASSLATEPTGQLEGRPYPPIRITEEISPRSITEPQPGTYIYDMGINFGGWIALTLQAPKGAVINFRYGELLNNDGSLNPMTSVCGQIKGMRKTPEGGEIPIGGPGAPEIAWQADQYISRGAGRETWRPRFSFHAFRYVEITGLPNRPSLGDVKGFRLNVDVASVGAFECSNEMFNRIQTMCRNTFLSNIFDVQSDCPHRERFGYGGDLVVTSDVFMLNLDMAAFYPKITRDWADAALEDGMLTDTAPFVGIQYCGVGWAMAHPSLQAQMLRYYGNVDLVREQFPVADKWLRLVQEQYPDCIVTKGLSDHEGLEAAPAPAMVTPLYCESARLLSQLARVAGSSERAEQYRDLAEKIRKAYVDQFYDPDTGVAGPGTQASQAFALHLDMLTEDDRAQALRRLLAAIQEKDGHLSTGIFGTRYLLEVLSRAGHAETAYTIVNQRTFPGWGNMLAQGATTLWEHWAFSDNTFSHNHPMFGSVSQWFFNWLGGIQPAPEAVGFDKIHFRPQVVKDLQWAKSSYQSVRGTIRSAWRRDKGRVYFDFVLPPNTQGTVTIPADDRTHIEEGGQPVDTASGVQFVREEAGAFVFNIESGAYSFSCISK